jgi:hypothetical protein
MVDRSEKTTLRHRLKWTRLHQLLHDNHGVRYFVMAVGITLAVGTAVLGWIWTQPGGQLAHTYPSKVTKPAIKYYSPLTGTEVADEALTKRPVTAIMIENSPDARPQSGIAEAGVVYETIAEAGITRFVALYQEARPSLIGPVRSVRPYYVEWASAYDPAMAHIGGSARALDMIRSGNYGVDLDQFFNAASYYRSSDRAAPHNVYTTFDRLDALTAAKGKTSSSFTPLSRKADQKAKVPTASHIDLPISSGLYAVDYAYDTASNSYMRSVGGAPHLDREKGQVHPKVVVAIEVPIVNGFEDGYREQITTTGSGQAYIFQDGIVTQGTWQRSDVKSQISFIDSNGKTISLDRGQTWITALPTERVPTWQ